MNQNLFTKRNELVNDASYSMLHANRFDNPPAKFEVRLIRESGHSIASYVSGRRSVYSVNQNIVSVVFQNKELFEIEYNNSFTVADLYVHPKTRHQKLKRIHELDNSIFFVYQKSKILDEQCFLIDLALDRFGITPSLTNTPPSMTTPPRYVIQIDAVFLNPAYSMQIPRTNMVQYPFETLKSFIVGEVKSWIEYCHRIPVSKQVIAISNHILQNNASLFDYIRKDESTDLYDIKLFCSQTEDIELALIYKKLKVPLITNISFGLRGVKIKDDLDRYRQHKWTSTIGNSSQRNSSFDKDLKIIDLPLNSLGDCYNVLVDFFVKSGIVNLETELVLLFEQNLVILASKLIDLYTKEIFMEDDKEMFFVKTIGKILCEEDYFQLLKRVTVKYLGSQLDLVCEGNSGLRTIKDVKEYLWRNKQIHVHLQRIFYRGKELNNRWKIPKHYTEETLVLNVTVESPKTVTLRLFIDKHLIGGRTRRLFEDHRVQIKDTSTIPQLKQLISELTNFPTNDITLSFRPKSDNIEIRHIGLNYNNRLQVSCGKRSKRCAMM